MTIAILTAIAGSEIEPIGAEADWWSFRVLSDGTSTISPILTIAVSDYQAK